MNNSQTSADRIRDAKLDTLLGERGSEDRRAVRYAEFSALLAKVETLTKANDALAKRITALENP